jgi:VCBS repeat-containing protein
MLHSIDDVLEVAYVSTGELDPDANTPTISAKSAPIGEDVNDAEDLSPMPVYGALGVTARPAARTDAGAAECLVARGIGDGVVLGMRDPRAATVYGNLAEGDTAVHSTDTEQSSQMLLKGDSKIASIVVKQSDGKQIVFSVDGENKKVQIIGFKTFFEMSEDQVTLGNEKCSIQLLADGRILLNATAVMVGTTAAVPVLCGAPPGAPCAGLFVKAV